MTVDVGRQSGAHIVAARFKALMIRLMRDLYARWRWRRVRLRMGTAGQQKRYQKRGQKEHSFHSIILWGENCLLFP